jgi:hypothetical protein
MSLDPSYDLLTVDDLINHDDYDWCGKCSGYAVRRLNESQVGYYRSAHRLHDINNRIEGHLENPSHLERERDRIAASLPELRELMVKKPDPEASEHDRDSLRWRDIAAAVEAKASRLLASVADGRLTQQLKVTWYSFTGIAVTVNNEQW